MSEHVIRCDKCGSESVVKHSVRYTKEGQVQQYRCKECLSYFSGEFQPFPAERLEQLRNLRSRFAQLSREE